MKANIGYYSLPFGSKQVLYDPLRSFTAIIDAPTNNILKSYLSGGDGNHEKELATLLNILSSPAAAVEPVPKGPLSGPLFLGLVTTRGCNLGCKYCDFNAPKTGQQKMDLTTARDCVDAYFYLLSAYQSDNADIQFFGGEPFFGNHVAEFILPYARDLARQMGINPRFTVTTNGMVNQDRARWIAMNFDSIILSLDGPEDIQNYYRPALKGKNSAQVINKTAEIFSSGSAELIIRSCVSKATLASLPAIAKWIGQNFVCSTVCFESITPSGLSQQHGIDPPDPIQFARAVLQAGEILDQFGIEIITSGTEIYKLQESFCPVGKDALIVTPEGNINACYLLEKDWQKKGLDLRYGNLSNEPGIPSFEINIESLQKIRALAKKINPVCCDCFCRYHCAGGCLVNHSYTLKSENNQFDDVCIQTRAITAGLIIKNACEETEFHRWLDDENQIIQTISGAARIGIP